MSEGEECPPRARSLTLTVPSGSNNVPSGSDNVPSGSTTLPRDRRPRPSCLQIFSSDRRLSRQSYMSASPCSPYNSPAPFPTIQYDDLWHRAFFLKLSELVVAAVCVLLYSLAVPHAYDKCKVTFEETVGYHLSGAIFPQIAFSSYLIISSILVLSYLLGQLMPAVLSRAFNLVGGTLFLTAAGVALHRWMTLFVKVETTDTKGCSGTPSEALLASAVLALLGATLHVLDVVLSLMDSIKAIDTIAPSPRTDGGVGRCRGRSLRCGGGESTSPISSSVV